LVQNAVFSRQENDMLFDLESYTGKNPSDNELYDRILEHLNLILTGICVKEVNMLTVGFLTLALSETIYSSVNECAKKNHWNISVAIVNSEGSLILFKRDENSYVGSADSSIEKAKSANAFRKSTSEFQQKIKEGANNFLSVQSIVAVAGGVPIIRDNVYFGALGVSGAKSVEDEQCATDAIKVLHMQNRVDK
jgi:glc operon protein GlcG